jgi:hypothetical protein
MSGWSGFGGIKKFINVFKFIKFSSYTNFGGTDGKGSKNIDNSL